MKYKKKVLSSRKIENRRDSVSLNETCFDIHVHYAIVHITSATSILSFSFTRVCESSFFPIDCNWTIIRYCCILPSYIHFFMMRIDI